MYMRELKFRAWSPVLNKYIIDYSIAQKADNEISGFFSADIESHDLILEQFTGLLDKNKVEIYEGDLLAEIDNISELKKWGNPLTVEFGQYENGKDSWGINSGTTGFLLRYKDGSITGLHNNPDSPEASGFYGFCGSEMLIVGNTHQNPELL
jgi:uncharacterized phage protein (TIGR01671 family)